MKTASTLTLLANSSGPLGVSTVKLASYICIFCLKKKKEKKKDERKREMKH